MKKILLILSCQILFMFSYAQESSTWQVTPQQALIKAKSFFEGRGVSVNKQIARIKAPVDKVQRVDSIAPYYVFNAGDNQGFVIVAGDDRIDAILGYADSGAFDVDSIPENMRAWLKGYHDAITFIEKNKVPTSYISATSSLKNKPAISPIVETQWNQSTPYNNQAPQYYGTRCLTGCVATAMAQVMNHARWPQSSTTSIPSYKTNNQIGELASLPATTFNWNVLAAGSGSSYETEVAKLMRYCGQAVKMNYGTGGSSAPSSNVAPAFSNYFGYTSARLINRNSYSIYEWDEMIYNEIANNRAVYYDGQSTGGGHAFVVDGYDGNGLFHINWGWGGYCDGYFKLSVLNPYSNNGYGASSSRDGYSMYQNAVIGLGSGNNLLEEELCCLNLSYTATTLSVNYYSDNKNSFNSYYGVAIMDENGKLKVIGNPAYTSFNSRNSINYSINLSTYLTTRGEYTIVPVYRIKTTDSWKRTANYNKYATVTVSSNHSFNITIHPIQQLSLESLTIDGNQKLGSEQILKFSVINTGDDFMGTVYCFMSSTNDKGNYISRAGIAIESGTTEIVDMYITPSEAGTLNVWLTTDMSGDKIIGKSSITITTDQTEPSNLLLNYTKSETGSGYATTTFRLYNDGQFTYGRPIYIELRDAVTNEIERNYTMKDISIKPGETKGWWVRYDGLDNTKIYNFNIYYYVEASGSEKKLAGTVKIIMPEAPVSTKHNLSISVSDGGRIEYSGINISGRTSSFEVLDGSMATLTITEDEGYRLYALEINGKDVTSDISRGAYTISNIKSNQNVNVTFVPLPTLTIKQADMGVVKIVVKNGTARTIKLCPQNGMRLESVKYNGQNVTEQVTPDYIYTTPKITYDSIIEVVYTVDGTKIEEVPITQSIMWIYSLDGIRLENLQKGVNIVKMTDGTIKKIVIK